MNFVKSQGYITVSFDSGWGFTRDMKSADLKLCGDNKIFNSNQHLYNKFLGLCIE